MISGFFLGCWWQYVSVYRYRVLLLAPTTKLPVATLWLVMICLAALAVCKAMREFYWLIAIQFLLRWFRESTYLLQMKALFCGLTCIRFHKLMKKVIDLMLPLLSVLESVLPSLVGFSLFPSKRVVAEFWLLGCDWMLCFWMIDANTINALERALFSWSRLCSSESIVLAISLKTCSRAFLELDMIWRAQWHYLWEWLCRFLLPLENNLPFGCFIFENNCSAFLLIFDC